jgi:LAGLIDADG endonuclease
MGRRLRRRRRVLLDLGGEDPGCRLGWQVQHEFSVTQASSSRAALELLQEVFGRGTILEQHRADNHRVSLCRFSAKRRAQLVGSVVPFFEERPLRTAKLPTSSSSLLSSR